MSITQISGPELMSASDHLSPHQFGLLHARLPTGDIGIHEVASRLYALEPDRMHAMETDVRERGVQKPVETVVDSTGRHIVGDGHHRAAVAYRAGVSLPRVDGPASVLEYH